MENILARIEKDRGELDRYIENKKKDVAILNQVIEPMKDATEELTEVMKKLVEVDSKDKDFFDKDFNKKLIESIGKILNVVQSYKQQDITPIAAEIKRGNDNIYELLKKPNQSEEVISMLSGFLAKQSAAFERLTKETDYTSKLDALIAAVGKKDRVEKIVVTYREGGSINEIIPKYKNS